MICQWSTSLQIKIFWLGTRSKSRTLWSRRRMGLINLDSNYWLFGPWKLLIQGSKQNNFSIQSSSKTVKFPFESLIEESKPVFREKSEFQYRGKSILLSFFGRFGLSEVWGKELNWHCIQSNGLPQVESFRFRTFWKKSNRVLWWN